MHLFEKLERIHFIVKQSDVEHLLITTTKALPHLLLDRLLTYAQLQLG